VFCPAHPPKVLDYKKIKYNSNQFNVKIVLLMIEIIFVRLATHLQFYVGTLDCQIQM
jgi:hypothetical protein